MAVGGREIADILKESTESKINAKTTWSSTLIDDFSNIEKFKEKETNSMNFQHASIVLDGCVKVYSTRVDSVVDEAEKLMDSVGRAKEPERQRLRTKTHPTIESNPEAILIKPKLVSAEDEILEYLSRESKEGDTRGLLMHLLKWSDKTGFNVIQTKSALCDLQAAGPVCSKEDLECIRRDTLVDFQAARKGLCMESGKKSISPMFSKFTPDRSVEELVIPTYAYNISYDAEPLDYSHKVDSAVFPEPDVYYGADEGTEYGLESTKECVEEGKDLYRTVVRPSKEDLQLVYTPFGYAKGWAGPSHWRIHARRRQKEKSAVKERKKAVIDFLADPHLPISTLFERGEGIVITPQQISERRKNCNTLPPNHNVKIEDLYQMFVYPGSMYRMNEVRIPIEEKIEETPFSLTNALHMDSMPPEVDFYEEHQEEADQRDLEEPLPTADSEGTPSQTTLLSRRLLQSVLRKARRNDIVKVKESLWSRIEEGERRVQSIYSSIEEQKVSVHFYLVSLLHLANEKNLRISSDSSKEHLPGISDLSLDTSLKITPRI